MDNAPALLPSQTNLALMQAAQAKSLDATNMNIKRIEEAAREFEAVFISEMIKPMFEGLETDELFGGGKGEEIFQGMMIQEYGKEIARLDITGIQSQVKNKLLELQEIRTTGNK